MRTPDGKYAVQRDLWIGEAANTKEGAIIFGAAFEVEIISPTTFGIFDVFHDEAGRDAHLAGEVAKALIAKAPELFSQPPEIEKVDVLASKLR